MRGLSGLRRWRCWYQEESTGWCGGCRLNEVASRSVRGLDGGPCGGRLDLILQGERILSAKMLHAAFLDVFLVLCLDKAKTGTVGRGEGLLYLVAACFPDHVDDGQGTISCRAKLVLVEAFGIVADAALPVRDNNSHDGNIEQSHIAALQFRGDVAFIPVELQQDLTAYGNVIHGAKTELGDAAVYAIEIQA